MRVRFGGVKWGIDTIESMIPHWCSILCMCRKFGSLASSVI